MPDTGTMGLPLNDVRQMGRKVEFGVRVAHAAPTCDLLLYASQQSLVENLVVCECAGGVRREFGVARQPSWHDSGP